MKLRVLGAIVALLTFGCASGFGPPTELPTPQMKMSDQPGRVVEQKEKGASHSSVIKALRRACLEKNEFWIHHEGQNERYACMSIDYPGPVDWGKTRSGHRNNPFETE